MADTTTAEQHAHPDDTQLTPAMRQFHRFKRQYPNCVLFFRMGDFYEMFHDDAVLANKVLGVTLTQRSAGVPMAGVPYHAVEGYLRRMIQAGYRVAVCDQMEDAAQAKGVVERDVTRVVTPGTLTDDALLEAGAENPLAAVVLDRDGGAALAWVELSTGSFHLCHLGAEAWADELARVAPKELLYPDLDTATPAAITRLAQNLGCALAARPAWQFRTTEGLEALKRQYGVARLDGFGLREDDPSLGAAGGVLHYLLETQRTAADGRLSHLRPPRRFNRAAHMVVDPTSLRALEVDATIRSGATEGSLLALFQRGSGCCTAMGKRLLRQWLCYPLCEQQAIEERQRVVQALVDDSRFLDALRTVLGEIQDVQRITARLAVGRITPRDLVALGRSAAQGRELAELLAGRPTVAPYAQRLADLLEPIDLLAGMLQEACQEDAPGHLRQGGLIRDGFDAELDEYRSLQRDSHAWLAQYQKRTGEEAGMPNLKVGYNKVFGYYIELSAANKDKAPAHWVRKQTLKNAERFITDDLKTFEGKVLSAESRAIGREQDIFDHLCAQAQQRMDPLHAFAETVAELDALACFARRAVKHRYVRPVIVPEPVLELRAARHPVLDELLGEKFVPNDASLGIGTPAAPSGGGGEGGRSLGLITGPNMAGKSTFIRQTALITLLAHTGSFVPAEAATVGLTDRIFTRIGASDELHTGQSTFMVEMTETANICHHATERSLVILDEIGRGTSTLDGLSLAWAIADFIAQRRCRCLFATHYHELTRIAEQYENVQNLSVTVREWQDEIVFLHRIQPGATDRSYGIHVAKIAGLPPRIIQRAEQLLSELAVSHSGARPTVPATPAATPRPAGDQMALFCEYLPHPVIEQLRQMDLSSLSPLQAFDVLRDLQKKLDL